MESENWSHLHDIGLLYLCCMHGTDAEIDPQELTLVRKLLQKRSGSQKQASSVLDDVILMYVGASGSRMLATSIASLGNTVDEPGRAEILQELADIASADGLVYPNEVQFIASVARQWDMEGYLGQSN